MEIIEIVIAVGVSMVTFFIGYGVIIQKVKTLQDEVNTIKADDKEAAKLYTQIMVTLTRIETELKHLTEKINTKD